MRVPLIEYPDPIDVMVGARMRARREEMGLTQSDVGAALKVTFQQVRKYETGQNRVAASRIAALCAILQVETAYFFETFVVREETSAYDAMLEASLKDEACQQLNAAFLRIERSKVRRQVIHFIENLAEALHEE